jgi:hypothetical protein
MKQKRALSDGKELRKQINGNFNNICSTDKNKFKEYLCRAFI